MKRNIFFLFLFSFFLFPFNIFAVSFNDCNNTPQEVVDNETLRDYCYFNYYNSAVNNIVVFGHNHNKACGIIKNTTVYFDWVETALITRPSSGYDYYQFYDYAPTNNSTDSGISSLQIGTDDIYYSVVDITASDDDNEVDFTANYTFDSIKQKYNCVETPPEPEEPEPEEPTEDVITKTDFYILLVLLSTLIWLLYFKWCFPNTKGRDF